MALILDYNSCDNTSIKGFITVVTKVLRNKRPRLSYSECQVKGREEGFCSVRITKTILFRVIE